MWINVETPGEFMADALRQSLSEEAADGDGGGPEQRQAHRFTLLIRAAKLITDQGEFLCVIRDASETGLAVALFHPLPACDRYLVEFQNGDRHEATLVWEREGRAGFQFSDPADIVRIIESPSEFTKRPMRVELKRQGMLYAGVNAFDVEMLNISPQGAKIACRAEIAIDRNVRLSVGGLPELQAKVRWRRLGVCGLVFENTLQLSELARLVAAIHGLTGK